MHPVAAHCKLCNARHVTEQIVTMEQIKAYECGALVQDAFPNHSLDDREILMSALRTDSYICPVCWDKTFEGDDE